MKSPCTLVSTEADWGFFMRKSEIVFTKGNNNAQVQQVRSSAQRVRSSARKKRRVIEINKNTLNK